MGRGLGRSQNSNYEEHFWTKVSKQSFCWTYEGHRIKDGYGQFWDGSKKKQAHRYAWEITYGEIPKNMLVCHHCDNPPCVRPDHLFLGTAKDNMQDCVKKGRAASGDRSFARKYPERLKRGKDNYFHKHPEMVRGENNPRALLTESQVLQIRQLYETGNFTYKELGEKYGMGEGNIGYIVKRKTWRHI